MNLRAVWERPRAWLPKRMPNIPFGLRVFFRGAFVLLSLATLALALSVLTEEKQRAVQAYQDGFAKTLGQISARLRHPTGQLALLNPRMAPLPGVGLHPVVLPFAAIDFDDRSKVQQAVEMAGCGVRYPLSVTQTPSLPGLEASLCVAIGNNPWAGGFLYAVGSVPSGPLTARRLGERDFVMAHRVRVTVHMRGQTFRWMAPFEAPPEPSPAAASTALTGPPTSTTSGTGPQRGRLTGFIETATGSTNDKPVRDFRGWLWREARCLEDSSNEPACLRQTFFSLRLPVEVFQDDLQSGQRPIVWPPTDLDRIQVRVQFFAPGDATAPLFDSAQAQASAPFSLQSLQSLLLPGETLRIEKPRERSAQAQDQSLTPPPTLPPTSHLIAELSGAQHAPSPAPLVEALIRHLPTQGVPPALQAHETVHTALGRYELTLTGDMGSVNRPLGAVAARLGWPVGAMLGAILLTWAALERRIIRRITRLTQRSAQLSRDIRTATDHEIRLDLGEMPAAHQRDELGLLAGTLDELLQRVNDDARRERIRVQQEKDQWHAVGHEIMSPLQSLMVLHADSQDPSHRYIQRMQQAIKVLYGQASPTEAFEATTLPGQSMDVLAFVRHVAENAHHAGIADVVLAAPPISGPVWVRGDEYALEDVVTHVLKNADRFRTPGSPITLTVRTEGAQVQVSLHNQGPHIPEDALAHIFDYGVSLSTPGTAPELDPSHRGQGLFVARTYMAKMGGTITAHNETQGGCHGVCFVLSLQQLSGDNAL